MDLNILEQKIGVRLNNINLLREAVTHRSYCNEHRHERVTHNERLEFLGDAVLELVITDHLMDRFPELQEGALTELRSALVKGTQLTIIADCIGLNKHLLLSKGEAADMKSRGQILADAVEAIIGAIYKDKGLEIAKDFIARLFFPWVDKLGPDKIKDAKSKLQEIVQAKVGITPCYEILSESGPDHDKHFIVGAYLGENIVAKGQGASRRAAEQDAAMNALKGLSK